MDNSTTAGNGHDSPANTPYPVQGHDDLLAEVLQEHASPEQQEAAIRAKFERENAMLRAALGQDAPEEEGCS